MLVFDDFCDFAIHSDGIALKVMDGARLYTAYRVSVHTE